jgi:hypothetical protein
MNFDIMVSVLGSLVGDQETSDGQFWHRQRGYHQILGSLMFKKRFRPVDANPVVRVR